MKHLVIALGLLAALATASSAYAYTCRTHCFVLGNQQYCNTTCQ